MVLDDTEGRLAAMRLEARRAGVSISQLMVEEIAGTLASDESGTARIKLSTAAFLQNTDRTEQSGTLAHELFHAVHSGANPKADDEPDWIAEGLATAVEYAWIGSAANIKNWDPGYDTPLNNPEEDYERGHFFFELGRALDDDMAYAGQIVQDSSNGDGIAWLDGYLRSQNMTLEAYYPDFIATKTDGSMFARPQSAQIDWLVPISSYQTYEIENNAVAAIASGYHPNTITFSGASGIDEKDRLYFLATGITTAERKEDLSLIVAGERTSSFERHLMLILAEDGDLAPALEIKVPNIAEDPSTTQAQTYDLAFEASPISFLLPECVLVGQDAKIELDGLLTEGDLNQIQNYAFSATAGRIGSDVVYTAPSTPTIAEIQLELPNSIGAAAKVLLGEIEVGSNDAATLDHSASPLVGNYTLDIGATMVRAQGITMSAADPFTIPTSRIYVVDGGLFLEATFQGQFVAFALEGEPCGNEFEGVGEFATGTAKISLTIERDDSGLRLGTGTMVHQAAQGQVSWDVTMNPIR